jgi:hypothetical protein
MVDKTILNYLKKYKDKYPLEELKKKIIGSGYSRKQVDEAVENLGIDKQKKEKISNIDKEKKTKVKQEVKASSVGGFNWLKFCAFAGIFFLVFLIISSFISRLNDRISFFLLSLSLIFGILFYYGFIILGKKHGKKFITVISWIFIIVFVLFFLFQVINLFKPNFLGEIFFTEEPSNIEDFINDLFDTLFLLLIILIVVGIVLIVLGILFGVGLLKLSGQVKYAKVTGILEIIGWSTLIIGIGFFVLLVSGIFKILLLFKASKNV